MDSISVRVEKKLYDSAVKEAKAEYRSVPQQINFWAKIGRNALANPDLPVEMVRDMLIALEEESEPFELEDKK